MAEYWLCEAGVTLRAQLLKKFPNKDVRSDGWIGDSSHAATVSDHNPCWTCSGSSYGVVRAIDVDEDLLGPATALADPAVANRFANQLIEACRNGTEKRVKYVIFEGKIASGTYASTYWEWRDFDGDPHTTHIHVSFNERGDHDGTPFKLPMFMEDDEMQKEDWERLGRMLDNRLEAVVPVIVNAVLKADVDPDPDVTLSVKKALRQAAAKDEEAIA